jgi:hypothetical protein
MAKKTEKEEADAKKKDEEELEAFQKFVKGFGDVLKSAPKEVWFSIILSWIWARTHGKHIPNSGDIILGTVGGFTLPSAMEGGWISNGWAAGYLSALALNFADDDDSWKHWLRTPLTILPWAALEIEDFLSDDFDYSKLGEPVGKFKMQCESFGGNVIPHPTHGIVCIMPDPYRDVPYKVWESCYIKGGDFDFKEWICNVPHSKI